MSWIQTSTGRRVFPLAPTVDSICIEDIAHHLSLICRFNGAVSRHYSVAEHSLLVAGLLPDELKLAGLLHDAAEAYIGDITRPIKGRLRVWVPEDDLECRFSQAEDALLQVIFKALYVAWPSNDDWMRIKAADDVALVSEATVLMPQENGIAHWALAAVADPVAMKLIRERWFPTIDAARQEFFEAFAELHPTYLKIPKGE